PLRSPRRLGTPDARADARVRHHGRGARTRGHHRGSRGRRPPARDGGLADARARARRAGAEPRAPGTRLAAVHRADARRRTRGDHGHRHGRRPQRGAPGRRDAGRPQARAAREAAPVPRRAGTARPRGAAGVAMIVAPGATLGVLGSGQLGRMFAIAARRLGYRVHTLSPDNDSPTGQIADEEVSASYDDLGAVRAFAQRIAVATFEFENVPAATVGVLA